MLCSEDYVVFRRFTKMVKRSIIIRECTIKMHNKSWYHRHKGLGLNKIPNIYIHLHKCCVQKIMLCSEDALKW